MNSGFTIFVGSIQNCKMKKIFKNALYITAILILAGCAKTVEPGPYEADKRYLDAWLHLNHPDAEASGLGIYILNANDGNGVEVKDEGFALVNYRSTDLEGNITSHTDAEAARQLGTYDTTSYYGPKFLTTYATTVQAGIRDALIGMHAGGYKKALVPSWLMTAKDFSTAKEYLDYHDSDNSTSYTPAIYEFEVVDFTNNVAEWQIDSIGRFFGNSTVNIDGKAAKDVFAGMAAKDSVSYGFYYKQISAPVNTTEFKKDTTIYINYTGKLLNGLVFDTTIEKVAKDNGLYSKSRSYKPVRINWGEKDTDITMGSDASSIISGFALTLWQMKAMEKGVGVFYSDHGYGYSGSGSSIPGYASLIFEIELVENPNE